MAFLYIILCKTVLFAAYLIYKMSTLYKKTMLYDCSI